MKERMGGAGIIAEQKGAGRVKSLQRLKGEETAVVKCEDPEAGTIFEEQKGQGGWSIVSKKLKSWRRWEPDNMLQIQSHTGLVKNLE